ncbi:MAG: hypothetical protein EOS40_31520 [Mesorhizobium sp.]|nr:MAG: hypothetical protein EOQ40_13200 [Mesorhizobium sp.]RWD96754.1 MAG: hypothetical protein EOS40_31520 [Mesorhizobium sp.]
MGSDRRLGSAGFRGDPRSWLRSLNVTRNIYAHHSRLWNRPSARSLIGRRPLRFQTWPISPRTYTLRRVIMLRQ